MAEGFEVTVLSRSTTQAFDDKVKVVTVDFSSIDSLTAALHGIDGVVSAVSGHAIEAQTLLVDAAVNAGVKRFIPSEFGSVTTSPKTAALPIYSSMVKAREYLQSKAGKLSWTVLAPGAFTEFLFHGSLLVEWKNHKAELYDGGDNKVSTTSLPSIGVAIAGIFKNPEATANKVLFISQAIVTQNQLLEFAKAVKPEIEWETSEIASSDVLKAGLEGLGKGDFSMGTILKVIGGTALGGEAYGGAYDETDNTLLGVSELSEEDVKRLVASVI